jgi:hypothetical protein
VQHLVLAYQLDQVALEGRRGAFDAGGVDGIVLRRACGPADGPYVGREHLPQ